MYLFFVVVYLVTSVGIFQNVTHSTDFETYFYLIGVVYVIVVVIRLVIKCLDVIYGFVLPKLFPPSNFVKRYGQWAIVTGCTQGIGRYYVQELAKMGMNIVLVSRNESKLEDLARTVKNSYGMIHTQLSIKKSFWE